MSGTHFFPSFTSHRSHWETSHDITESFLKRYRTPAGNACPRETPQAKRRGGSRTARGKRALAVT
ncbi:hypothetical protein CVN76_24025 [Bacillus sp. mrc49]|nr:hypothetical protein CVN76_24025 [Bacillus sp. mrc49]